MDSVTYTLVYDAATQSLIDYSDIWGFVFGLCMGTAVFIYSYFYKKHMSSAFFAFLWLAGWLIIGGLGHYNVYHQKAKCKKWVQSGNYQIVEGVVEDFDPMPKEGHKQERFTVNGIEFDYSDYDLTKGSFNNTASHGGPIKEGLRVKIAYKDGRILKLWIEEKGDSNNTDSGTG